MILVSFGGFSWTWYRWEAYMTAAILALMAGMIVGWFLCRAVIRWTT